MEAERRVPPSLFVGGNAAGGSTGGSGGAPLFAYNNPKDLTNPPSGYVSCANRMIHRAEKKQCPESIGRPQFLSDAGADCHKDSDCVDKPHGHCEQWASLIGSGTRCEYGCVTDAECGAGQICLCGNPTGRCVAATGCTVDSDCGGVSSASGTTNPCDKTRFACQTPADACGGDLDCPSTGCPECACQKNGTKAVCLSKCVQ